MDTQKFNTEKVIKDKILNHEFKLDDSLWASMDQKLDQAPSLNAASVENNTWKKKWITLTIIGLSTLAVIWGAINLVNTKEVLTNKKEPALVNSQLLKKANQNSQSNNIKSIATAKTYSKNSNVAKSIQNKVETAKSANTITEQSKDRNFIVIEKKISNINAVGSTSKSNSLIVDMLNPKNNFFLSENIPEDPIVNRSFPKNKKHIQNSKNIDINQEIQYLEKAIRDNNLLDFNITPLPTKEITLLSTAEQEVTSAIKENHPPVLSKSKTSMSDILDRVTFGVGLECSRTSHNVSKNFPDLLFTSIGQFTSFKPGLVISVPVHKRLRIQVEGWYNKYNLDYEVDATWNTDPFNVKSQIVVRSIESVIGLQINIFKGLNLSGSFGYQFSVVEPQNFLNYEPNYDYGNLYNQVPTNFNKTVPFYDIGFSYRYRQLSFNIRKRNYFGRYLKFIVYEATGSNVYGKRSEISVSMMYHFKK